MARDGERDRDPTEVETFEGEDGKTYTRGRDGQVYHGNKRGRAFRPPREPRPPRMPHNWGQRQHRLSAIVRSFTRFNGDMVAGIASFLADMEPEKREALLRSDPWFSKDFAELNASMLLEEGLFLNMITRAMSFGAGSMKATHDLLMALNKDRYNPSVQAAGKLNEGIVEGFRALAQRPMTRQQIFNILITDEKFVPVQEMARLEVPSLDEAIEMAKVDGTFVENHHIREDKDLVVDGE